jgi:uncharacterized membrane protein YgcG
LNFPRSLLSGLLAAAVAVPAWSQEPPPSPAPAGPDAAAPAEEPPLEEDEAEVEGLVVTAGPRRGSVIGDIPPEIELNARDIRALGAGSLSELLETLGPQIRSGRGRDAGPPVILLNGRRISGFSEIRGIPPEAIQRMEILPEEVALKYGYRADQRVVNIVLRNRFRATTVQAGAGVATAGGRAQTQADVNVLRIRRDTRTIFDLEHRHSEALLESERDIAQAPARPDVLGETRDARGFRTLLPQNDQVSLNATLSRPLFGDVSATLNARFDASRGESLLGLPVATFVLPAGNPYSTFPADVLVQRYADGLRPLTRETSGNTGHLGLALNGLISDWRWSFTANGDRSTNVTRTDAGFAPEEIQARLNAGDPALDPFGPLPSDLVRSGGWDRSRSINQSANAELVVNGSLAELPAGELSTTVSAQLETRSLQRYTRRGGVEDSGDLSRDRGSLKVNVDLPIASRRREVLTGLGNLTANANVELDQLSDFGTLRTIGYGLNWAPTTKLNFIASVTQEEGAPSIQQLGDPVVLTPDVPVFDFVRGETVDVTAVEGGNPALLADSRRVFKLSANLRPFEERDLSLSVNYTNSRIDDPISSFPAATAEIEAAFPERFQRDADGRLVRFDARPVNFARAEREEVRWGLNYSRPLRAQPTPDAGAAAARPAPAGEAGAAPPADPAATAREERRRARAASGQSGAPAARPPGEARGGGGFGGPRGGGGRGGFGGGGFGGGGGDFGAGRLQLALYHTLRLEDSILIRDGLPELDLLEGAALGSRGGRPRHELELQAGIFRRGMGARLEGTWQSGTFVRGGEGSARQDLTFSDVTTLNLRLFADLGQQRSMVERWPWLRGSRVTLAVNNLLDSRPEVRDETGLTPISYQPDRLDPLGRTVRLTFRKLFIGARPQRRPAGE